MSMSKNNNKRWVSNIISVKYLNLIPVSSTSLHIAVRQIILIAYMTGILWLRRNPISLVFSAISPFSLLFVLFVVSNGQYLEFAVSGSLVMALVGYGLALGQDISFYKTEYKIQDVFVASPVSSLTYMSGFALSQILFGLPALMVLAFLTAYLGTSITFVPFLIFTIFLVWGAMSSYGFLPIISHAPHAKCNPDNFLRECDFGCFATRILFN